MNDIYLRLGQQDSAIRQLQIAQESSRLEINTHLVEIQKVVASMNNTLSQAQGGWKVVMLLGTLVAAIGSTGAWVFTTFFRG